MASDEVVTLVVPAELEYVRIVRLTASGVASRLGFDVEEIEDLRVAVDELASLLAEQSNGSELRIRFTVRDAALHIEGRAAVDTRRELKAEALTAQILAAVVDEYDLRIENGDAVFCCTRRLADA
jgi:serine/threonine-protein kinase RsbW